MSKVYKKRRKHSLLPALMLTFGILGVVFCSLSFAQGDKNDKYQVSTKKPAVTAPKEVLNAKQNPMHYYVKGNAIYDSAGKQKIFHGINRPSLEWNSNGDMLSFDDYQLMKSWGANIIRLPLNQQFWIEDTSSYKSTVAQQIAWIESLDMDVIIDLHWSVGGNTQNKPDQYNMADEYSLAFWNDIANSYKNDPRVLFELYNEPRNINWRIWKNGGQTTDDRGSFNAIGMQQLYDNVRSTGAENLILIGGINWAFDLSNVIKSPVVGKNIVYASHPYSFEGKSKPEDWDKAFGIVSRKYPVLITEFGSFDCSTALYINLMDYTAKHNIGWVAWGWFPGGCGFPGLIKDWSGTPSATGQVIKSHLDALKK